MSKGNKVITSSEIAEAIGKGFVGKLAGALAMPLLGLDKINRYHERNCDYKGPEFAARILKDVGVSYNLPENQLEYIPREGNFITVSNHAYGSIDGLLLCSIIGSKRPGYKLLTNFLLSRIPALKESFMPVNPYVNGEVKRSSFSGIRMALEHIKSGNPAGFFPSGSVASDYGNHRIEEQPWADNIIKIIRNAAVPVVPVYFHGTNSGLFHRLGRIHPLLRSSRLPRELFNKRGSVVEVRIGKPVSPAELKGFDDVKSLGEYLRSRVYALEAQIEPHITDFPADKAKVHNIAGHVNTFDLNKEIESIQGLKLFSSSSFDCYLADSCDIPLLLKELGICREETFRKNGEGTNQELDLDRYDSYFKHLILWDSEKSRIAGSYRLGIGEESYRHGGLSGFHTSSLVDYKEEFIPVLKESMELGRSFVASEYQGQTLPLMLLFKGILKSLEKYPEVKHLVGLVSISQSFPKFYQSVIIEYLTRYHSSVKYKGMASPTHPFAPDFLRMDADALLMKQTSAIDALDKLMMKISDNRYRIPPLVRKYIKCGAEVICINIDYTFNDSLDALIIQNVDEIPESELRFLSLPL